MPLAMTYHNQLQPAEARIFVEGWAKVGSVSQWLFSNYLFQAHVHTALKENDHAKCKDYYVMKC